MADLNQYILSKKQDLSLISILTKCEQVLYELILFILLINLFLLIVFHDEDWKFRKH